MGPFFVAKWYSVFEGEDLGKNVVDVFVATLCFVPTIWQKSEKTCKVFANEIRWIKPFWHPKGNQTKFQLPLPKRVPSGFEFSQLRMSNFPSNLRNSSPKLDTPWSIFLGSELRQGNVSKHSLKMVSETHIVPQKESLEITFMLPCALFFFFNFNRLSLCQSPRWAAKKVLNYRQAVNLDDSAFSSWKLLMKPVVHHGDLFLHLEPQTTH